MAKKTPARLERDVSEAVAKDRLSTATYPTGIAYADRFRERNGDYLRLAFLPFGQEYRVSSSGQTVKLGQ